MGLPKTRNIYTGEEYLTMESAASERHEFLDGEIFAMAGESGPHGDICVNIIALLATQLRGTDCRARTKGTKVRSGLASSSKRETMGLYSYPDIVIICGQPEYRDEHTDVVMNPTVIIEVLSPSTEAFDRGEKFTRYQIWNQL